MEYFTGLLRWCIDHWKVWGIGSIIGGGVAFVGWYSTQRKNWKEARTAKAHRAIDGKVIKLLQTHDGWKNWHPITGAGDIQVRSAEIAERASLDQEEVIESLERLEAKGRVKRVDGTSDNPAPRWQIIHR